MWGADEAGFVEQARRTDAIKFARSEALQKSLGNSEFIALDLSTFDENAESESFDFITTFDAIHDQAKPLNVLKGVHRALKPEGVYLMQDISGTSHMDRDIEHPIGTFLYTISCMHCMTVSLAQGGEVLGAIGGREDTRLRATSRFSIDYHNPTRARHSEQLVCREEVAGPTDICREPWCQSLARCARYSKS